MRRPGTCRGDSTSSGTPSTATSRPTRAAGEVLARLLLMQLHRGSVLRDLGVVALASADQVSGGSRQLVLSASLPEGVEVAQVRQAFGSAIEQVRKSRCVVAPLLIARLATQFAKPPDFTTLRKQLVARGRAANALLIEGGAALLAVDQELRLGVPLAAVSTTYREVDVGAVRRLLSACVTVEHRRSLCLTPAR